MKNSRILIVSILIVCLIVVPVNAVDHPFAKENKDEIEAVIIDFLSSYLDSIYLYKTPEFSTYTIASKECKLSTLSSSELSTLSTLQNNIAYLSDKVYYFAYARKAQGIYRKDFQVDFEISNLFIETNSASATVTAKISFQYTDASQPSYLEDVFFVELLNLNNSWFISDMTENNCWFDYQYKDSPSFEINALIRQLEIDFASQANQETVITGEQPVTSKPNSLRTEMRTLSYNPANATAYAFTYTTSISNNTATDFYNDNFANQDPNGGDCMNFVSQCIWAGFGGSNVAYAINNQLSPMDTVGNYVWYGTGDDNVRSSSWISCSAFRTYQKNQPADEVGLHTVKYNIDSGASFSAISNYASILPGSLLHVNSSSSDYSHAIIVTDVYGPERSNVYFCGHNSMRKYVKVGDRHPNCPIYVYQPTSFITNLPTTTRSVSAILHRPVPAGTQLPLTATTDLACYKIITTVTAPSGASSAATTYNQITATRNYTFTEKGLYVIQVSVYTTSTSTPTSYYYTIRTY